MANLTAPLPREFRGLREMTTLPASGAIFQGALVEEDANGRLANVTGAGTTYVGVAMQSATAQGENVEVAQSCTVRLTVTKATNWAQTDVGVTVFASDGGDAFTLTSASNQSIGKVVEIVSGIGTTTASVWVFLEGQAKRSI